MPAKKKRPHNEESTGENYATKKSKSFCEPSGRTKQPGNNSHFSQASCIQWFNQYTMKEVNMGPEGMERLCRDLNISPNDIVMLVLAHMMNAKSMGYFTREEWVPAMVQLRCDSTEKLREKLPYLRGLLKDPQTFQSIYRYAYGFSLEDGCKSLELSTAIPMLTILLHDRWPLLQYFFTFLKSSRYKFLSRDQWNNLLELSNQVLTDLSNYEEDGAWPIMIDEFVEWLRRMASTSSMDTASGLPPF